MKPSMKYIVWLVLTIPAIGLMTAYFTGQTTIEALLHPTGEFSARFMIIAMLATPLMVLFRSIGWSLKVPLWLMRYRRAFGVAAFGYALLHTVLYLVDIGVLSKILSDLVSVGIWTGWLAFLIFIPLAVTSNDRSQRYLRTGWKKLQRWVYPAAVLTLLHWIFVHNNIGPALIHFVPLAALELFRVYTLYSKKSENPNKLRPQ